MKHYDHLEWLLYKENSISEEKHKEMEEHLYHCDKCMDVFLSLIDSQEIDEGKMIASPDFTSRVMNEIKKKKQFKKTTKKYNKSSLNNIFLYYVAAASVAIILTCSGFYKDMIDIMTNISETTINYNMNEKGNIIYHLSEKIVGKTSSFITNFEMNNKEESK